MQKPTPASTAARGLYSSQSSLNSSCPCPHLSEVLFLFSIGSQHQAIAKGPEILHMPPLLTMHLIGLQPFVFHSQDNQDQIHEKGQHFCNTRQLVRSSSQLENTYKTDEIKGNAFILTWKHLLK